MTDKNHTRKFAYEPIGIDSHKINRDIQEILYRASRRIQKKIQKEIDLQELVRKELELIEREKK